MYEPLAILGIEEISGFRSAGGNPTIVFDEDQLKDMHIVTARHLTQGETCVIDLSSPSLPIPNVGLIISCGKYTTKVWDTTCSQLVTTEQLYTKQDHARQLSWLNKTGTVLDGAKFMTLLSDIEFKRISHCTDPWSSAWNEDIMWTVLTLVSLTPGRAFRYISRRVVPDNLAVQETLVRLNAMDCIEDKGHGMFMITTLGQTALDLRKTKTLQPLSIDIFVDTLFARCDDRSLPDNVRRVMARLAAIIACDMRELCRVERDAAIPSIETAEGQSMGIGSQLTGKGHLWVALGAYLKALHEGKLGDDGTVVMDG
ncbi:hypothetical protein G7054_g1416 [Neopestalotiopsis clavispora]|nr:hypothetical protein G7054_g1416 [Neopestalotiopsis clavispora]